MRIIHKHGEYIFSPVTRLNPASTVEVREAFDLLPNSVPKIDQVPGFTDSLLHLDQACRELALKLLHCIAIGLHLSDENFFVKCHQDLADRNSGTPSDCVFRTLYYPIHPASKTVNDTTDEDGKVRCGTHTDYGTLTLLFQDEVGGLEVESMNKDVFVPVTPMPGAVLVNIGDLLQQWTSDELRATVSNIKLTFTDTFRCKKIFLKTYATYLTYVYNTLMYVTVQHQGTINTTARSSKIRRKFLLKKH